jgi:hypothetical protein
MTVIAILRQRKRVALIDALHVSFVLLGPAGVHRDIPLRPTVLVTRLFVVMATFYNLHKRHFLGVFPKLRTATLRLVYPKFSGLTL